VTSKNAHSTGGQCTTCNHPNRAEIEEQLVAGSGLRPLAKKYGMNYSSLSRHRSKHMTPGLVAIRVPRDGDPANGRLAKEIAQIEAQVEQARESGRVAQWEKAMALLLRAREVQARFKEPQVVAVNLHRSEEWREIRALLFDVLAAHPKLRAELAQRLMRVEGPHPPGNGQQPVRGSK
jgi:hypothetical protein